MKRIALVTMITLAAIGLWANGNGETTEKVSFSQEELSYQPARDITVEPTAEILAVFEANGIESRYLVKGSYTDGDDNTFYTPAPVTLEVRAQLEAIIGENKDNVVDMIQAELKSRLHRGGSEKAHMTVGSYLFAASLDYPEA